MKLRCAIVDDEPLAVSLLESYARKTPFLELISTYSSALEAKEGIAEEPVDLLFLDIQMPELNGMEFAKTVDAETRIVFTTAFSQYALEGYRANALDYLLKPISYNQFLEAANKALNWFEMKSPNEQAAETLPESKEFFYVKSEHKLVKINVQNITYIEGLKDYIKIYLEDQPKAILSLMRMRSLEEYLPSDQFMRIHRSYIVNMKKIDQVERGHIIFGKNYIPISENCRDAVFEFINKHSIQ